VTTDEFIALAEQISGQELDELFQAWLFTPGKPVVPVAVAAAAAADEPAGGRLPIPDWPTLGLRP
jgi:aminopeptidase N